MAKRFTPRTAQQWASVLPRYIGMLGLIACAIFWAITDRLEPFLFTGFMGMVGIGQGVEALLAFKPPPEVSPEAPDEDA